jgi:hypothetical protein
MVWLKCMQAICVRLCGVAQAPDSAKQFNIMQAATTVLSQSFKETQLQILSYTVIIAATQLNSDNFWRGLGLSLRRYDVTRRAILSIFWKWKRNVLVA